MDALRSRDVSASASRVRDGLVAAEVAPTLMLLVGAGLLTRRLFSVSRVPLGFDPQSLVTVDLRRHRVWDGLSHARDRRAHGARGRPATHRGARSASPAPVRCLSASQRSARSSARGPCRASSTAWRRATGHAVQRRRSRAGRCAYGCGWSYASSQTGRAAGRAATG